MIEIEVPGYRTFHFEYLVLDYNGTLARDGLPLEGVKERLVKLAEHVEIHVLTADTFGKVRQELSEIPCQIAVLPPGNQVMGKLTYLKQLGGEATVCMGNGRNDRAMLGEAALGIALIQEEGVAIETLVAADIACNDIKDALDLLTEPKRLIATLRF